MGKRNVSRELPKFTTTANGFNIKYYGRLNEKQKVEFIAEISRLGPVPFKVMELTEVNLSLLIMESIEWTYYYKHGRNENNDRIDRYSKRTLPKLGRDGSSMGDILSRGVDYKHNPGQYQ